ncbi:MAG: LytTR family DNA-binding domain-containing protein [Bacteroidota bacterium]
MEKLTCLIIEDEPIAAEVLKDYIQEVSFLELKGICKDAIFALEKLNQEVIDVIFLDIHLPKLKGLEFLKTLTNKPQTILTTAYHEYTLQAFEEGVVDYLMKPIEFSRFLKAVNKLEQKERSKSPPLVQQKSKRAFHFFNISKKKVKVYYDEVLYIESLKDYSRIFTRTNSLVTRGQIGEMDRLFQEHDFLRIHRSFIIALDKIKAYSATEIEIEGKSLPIGRSYKELVAKQLEGYFASSL